MADDTFPRRPTTASGTCLSWTVEARCRLPHPKEIGGILLGENWKTLEFVESKAGVIDGPRWLFEGRNFGHLSYPAAQALRWWFVANAYATNQDNGLEVRLVRHRIKYERSATAIDAVEQMDSLDWLRIEHGDGVSTPGGATFSRNTPMAGKDEQA